MMRKSLHFMLALAAIFVAISCGDNGSGDAGELPNGATVESLPGDPGSAGAGGAANNGFPANSILNFDISGDGRFIILTTNVQLTTADQDTLYDVYRLDRNNGTWTLISTNLVSNAFSASMTDAGDQILYTASQSPVGAASRSATAIYLSSNGTITPLQEGSQDPLFPWPSFTPLVGFTNVISPDGSTVGVSIDLKHIVAPLANPQSGRVVSNGQPVDFSTNGGVHAWVNVDILTPGQSPAVWRTDVAGNSDLPITNTTKYSDNPKLSGNGDLTVFVSELGTLTGATDNNGLADIFLYDHTGPRYTRLTPEDANGPSNAPDISADGRVIVFNTSSNNLGLADNNLLDDIIVQIDGSQFNITGNGDGQSVSPKISADGRFVVFVSTSTNFGTTIPTGGGALFVAGPLR